MKKRLWDDSEGDDPAAGLINLFDVWIAFAAALLLAVVSFFNLPKPSSKADAQADQSPTAESIDAARTKIERFQESKASKSGEGERLGTAYRLKSGEIIYVRDKQK